MKFSRTRQPPRGFFARKSARRLRSKIVGCVLGILVIAGGVAWLYRVSFHIIQHREWSFLSEGMSAFLITCLGIFMLYSEMRD